MDIHVRVAQTSEGAIEDHGVTRITDSIQSDPGISRTTEEQPGRHKARSSLTWFGNIGALPSLLSDDD